MAAKKKARRTTHPPIGEDTLLICDACGYAANRQIARFRKPETSPEEPLPLEPVATPDSKTIEDLANFLGLPKSRTAKAVFMVARSPRARKWSRSLSCRGARRYGSQRDQAG